jgi:hypothetical protein
MRYIHQHPAERRFITDIAPKVGLGESQLGKIVNRDYPWVFYRIPKIGLGLTGKWPVENIPVDLGPRKIGSFEWNPQMLKVANGLWLSHTGQTLLDHLRLSELHTIENIAELGRHITELAEALIHSGAIGTARQDEWTPE